MTITSQNLALTASISGTQREGSSSDVLSYSSSSTLADGTGNSQGNKIYFNDTSLTSGGTTAYNLTSLARTIFGNTVSQSFSNVKGLYVENESTGTGYTFTMNATGTAAFTDMFNGESGNIKVHPGDAFILMNSLVGWTITTGNCNFALVDDGSGCEYRIGILGV